MITLLQSGKYALKETKNHTKILVLDRKGYAWTDLEDLGEIVIVSHRPSSIDHVLAVGSYRLYKVKNEPHLTDNNHLELFTGESVWQGYLLPVGLPTKKYVRNRIIPTNEIITRSSF